MRIKKKYTWYLLILIAGLAIRIARDRLEIVCPRCLYRVVPMTLHERFTKPATEAWCDTCKYLFPLKSSWICGIHYWSYNEEAMKEDYNHYKSQYYFYKNIYKH